MRCRRFVAIGVSSLAIGLLVTAGPSASGTSPLTASWSHPEVTCAVGGTQYIAATSGSPSNFWVDQFAGAPTVVVFKVP